MGMLSLKMKEKELRKTVIETVLQKGAKDLNRYFINDNMQMSNNGVQHH